MKKESHILFSRIYRGIGFFIFTLKKIRPFQKSLILVIAKVKQKLFGMELRNIRFKVKLNGINTKFTVNNIEQYTYLFKIFYNELFKVTCQLSEEPVIIDGGANIGITSLYYISNYPNAKIFAFEPSKNNVILYNYNLNGIENVRIEQKALWDKSETLTFNFSDCSRYHSAFLRSESRYVEEVKAIRLEDWIQEHDLNKIDVLKLNVEGAELKVIRGLGKYISLITVIIGEFHPEFVDKEELINKLIQNDFRVVRFEKVGKTVSIFEAHNQNQVIKFSNSIHC